MPTVTKDNALNIVATTGHEDERAGLPLFEVVVRRWRFLVIMVVVGTTVGVLAALLVTPLYTATALVMPPPKPQSLASMMMGQIGAMAGSLSPSLGLKDPADLYIGILRSRTIGEALVTQFRLQEVYGGRSREETLKRLAKFSSFTTGKDSLLRISVEDSDPKRAADLANAYISQMHVQNNRLAVTESAQRRLFFEQQLQTERTALASAEMKLKTTQQRTGLLEPGRQAEAVIRSIAQLQAEIVAREVSLQRLRLSATSENPEVARQESELASLRKELSKLESGSGSNRIGNPLVPLGQAPQSGIETLRSIRELKYHETLFELLAKQYEAAKIDEAKESQIVQVVDAAVPPEKKSWPPRALFVILSALTSVIVGLVFLIVSEVFGRGRKASRMA